MCIGNTSRPDFWGAGSLASETELKTLKSQQASWLLPFSRPDGCSGDKHVYVSRDEQASVQEEEEDCPRDIDTKIWKAHEERCP